MKRPEKVLNNGKMAILIVIAILLIDQVIKIWVKTNMTLYETIDIASWFKIRFIENNGMAYGMEIGSKLVLSVFRIVAVSAIGYYIYKVSRRTDVRRGYVACMSMVAAGAAGNILDSMFYGTMFNGSSEFYTSYFVPFGSGYAPFDGQGGRYVLLPAHCHHVAVMDACGGRAGICVLQPHFQLCGCGYKRGSGALAAVLPQGTQLHNVAYSCKRRREACPKQRQSAGIVCT